MKFVNMVCPKCNNPNYMVLIDDYSEGYKYKCINCNRYFNDIDFEQPLSFVWKSECINTEIDMEEVVRCKDCILRYTDKCVLYNQAFPVNKPNEWYCADGKRK